MKPDRGEDASRLVGDHAVWLARSLGRGELAPLPPEDVDSLSAELGEASYEAGTCIFVEGESPARVHVVREGTIALTRRRGGRRIDLGLARTGDVIGDMPLFLRMMEPFDACAVEDSTVLTIDSETLFELLEQRPRLAWRWLVSLAGRMETYQRRVADLLAGELDIRIASHLVREAEDGELEITQGTLAGLLGATRPSVNQVLRRLADDGVIATGYGRITIVDESALVSLASMGKTAAAVGERSS